MIQQLARLMTQHEYILLHCSDSDWLKTGAKPGTNCLIIGQHIRITRVVKKSHKGAKFNGKVPTAALVRKDINHHASMVIYYAMNQYNPKNTIIKY